MSSSTVSVMPPGSCLRLSNVDWMMYTRLLRIFAERPGVRLTYDRGELEIMAPLLAHDHDGRFVFTVVSILTDELGLPLMWGGTTPLKRRLRQRGIEADECFWIANAQRLPATRRLNLRRDPPPDLAVEVDVSRSSLNRMSIYAALRVPEVWRLDGDVLTFHVLDPAGQYTVAAASVSFPIITPADLLVFIQRARQTLDKNPVIRDFRAWVRQRVAKQT